MSFALAVNLQSVARMERQKGNDELAKVLLAASDEVLRLRKALVRLASPEAFDQPTYHVTPEADARMKYADEALH